MHYLEMDICRMSYKLLVLIRNSRYSRFVKMEYCELRDSLTFIGLIAIEQ